MGRESVPDWVYTPAEGWTADNFERLPAEAPHCEVLDGDLIIMAAQRRFHSLVNLRLFSAFDASAPAGWHVAPRMSIRIDQRNRPVPDLLVLKPGTPLDPDRTWYSPSEVALVVEVVSPDSVLRDRIVKPKKFAHAGIPQYWRIEVDAGAAVVHVFELGVRQQYTEAAVERRQLEVEHPFPFSLDVSRLYP
jgi:Uma2 family endonuclease